MNSPCWFFLDTAERGRVRLALLTSHGKGRSKTIEQPRVNVPSACAAFLSALEVASLTGICVVSGPGSFSAVRAGVLAANLLARTLNLPLVGVSVDEAHDLAGVKHRLLSGESQPVSYVAPVYDAEPNITC